MKTIKKEIMKDIKMESKISVKVTNGVAKPRVNK
jgi:hypothetical protein